MNSKRVFVPILIFLVCTFCKVNGQSNTSSVVVVRGYVVRQLSRQEVMNRLSKNSNSVPVDSEQKTYFLSFGPSSLDAATDSLNVLHREHIVFLPSKETNELIGEFCKDKTDLVTHDFPGYKNDAVYFEIKGKAPYLYQYYYIECKAIKTAIPNNSHNAFELNIIYSNAVTDLTCYFIFDTVILQPVDNINSQNIQPFDLNKKIAPHESGHQLHDH